MRARLTDDMKNAMKSGDKERLGTIRLVQAAIKDLDIAMRGQGKETTDADLLGLLAKMVKQREESAKVYIEGGRPELAEKEKAEIAVIQDYLPKQLRMAKPKRRSRLSLPKPAHPVSRTWAR